MREQKQRKTNRCSGEIKMLGGMQRLLAVAELSRYVGYQLKPGQIDRTRDWAVVTKKTV